MYLSAILVLAGTSRIAAADTGISISSGRIDVSQGLAPGGRYHLPTLKVTNTGDRDERYEIDVSYLESTNSSGRPPRGWFNISPSTMELAAGKSEAVELDIDLPTGARPGSYAALIEAHPAVAPNGTTISSAAATRVSFTIKPSNWMEAWSLQLGRAIDDHAPWSYGLPARALAAMLLYGMRRRLRIRVNVERRR